MTYIEVIIAYYMFLYLYNYPLQYESTNWLLRCNAFTFNRILWLAEDKVKRLSDVETDVESRDQLWRQGDQEAQRAGENSIPTSK